ncbi:hypothetical protein MTO96_013711 [Rhipicephalus appendiculatus]
MDQLFGNLKGFFKTDFTVIDNNVFRLHYKATVCILIAFSILVTGRQYIGDPIDCISKDAVPPNLLDTFCWIHTTFSLTDAWHKKVGVQVPYPGVDKYTPGEKRVYHAYYQWVCFVLFLQAVLFYVPRYFWKAVEGGRVKNLILGLNNPILPEEAKENSRKLLVEYLAINLNNHNIFFYGYVVAEVCNFVNVVGQMFLMDMFLGGRVLQLRFQGAAVHRVGLVRALRPHDQGVPQANQVHLPHVRFLGRRAEARCHVHPAHQHHQREDLRFPLVLVHHPRRALRCGAHLQGLRHLPPANPLHCPPAPRQARQQGLRGARLRPLQARRLAHSRPALQEHGSRQLPRSHQRLRATPRPQEH